MDNLEESPKNQALLLPKEPGVYFMKNKAGVIIYIGKAKVLRARVSSYFNKQKGRPQRLKHLIKQIVKIDYLVTSTEVEAFLLEASLIKKHRPKYNIRLKDDRSYPYIKCSLSEEYPRFSFSRKVKQSKDIYYGPFTSSHLVRENINFLSSHYKIRDCSNGFMKSRNRPCLTYEIKRCTAPCVEFTTKRKYKNQVLKALKFLDGDTEEVVKSLEKEMRKVAENEEFERAAEIRDQLKSVNHILEKQRVVLKEVFDRDIISYISHEKGILISMIHTRKGRVLGHKNHFISEVNVGIRESVREKVLDFLTQYYLENFIPDDLLLDYDLGRDLSRLLVNVLSDRKKSEVTLRHTAHGKLKDLLNLAHKNGQEQLKKHIEKSELKENSLKEIQKKFSLMEVPYRIECYDISNFQGDDSVGSQVVFNSGEPSPEDYRIYKIKTVKGSDDFKSMKEVLSRRLLHTEYQDPQLILIDGGKGQLKKAFEALKEIGREDLPIVGLAKSREKGEFQDDQIYRTEERFFLVNRSNPITFKKYSGALKILTQIRDEAHRFAITHHRRLREKKSLKGVFFGIPGLGPKSLKNLEDFLKNKINWTDIVLNDLKKIGLNGKVSKEVLFHLKGMIKEDSR